MLKKIRTLTCFSMISLCCFSANSLGASYNENAATTNAKLGLAYLEKGMYPESKNALLTAISEDPKIAAVWYSMAYYLEKTSNTKSAEVYYRKAISIEPHSGAAKNNYGTFLCRQGQYKSAIAEFVAATHEPNYLDAASAYENAGICAQMIPDKALALKYFHKAFENNPSMPFTLLSLARLSHQTGDDKSAEKYYMYFEKLSLAGKSADIVQHYHDYVFR